jgi:hypothetical protein
MTLIARSPHEPTGRANARPMTGSTICGTAAKTRISQELIRATVTNTPPHSRGTMRPSFANSSAPEKRGRREDRVRAAPAVSCAKADKKTHMSIQVQRKQSGLPCAMVLQLISCSPRRDLACLSPSFPRSVSFPKNLTPAIGASGPHDFAVRVSRIRQSQLSRPSHPTARFVTCATPLLSGGTAPNTQLIWAKNKAEYFSRRGWTGFGARK